MDHLHRYPAEGFLRRPIKATNRHDEAEPMMRRALRILVTFGLRTGHKHPNLKGAIDNYTTLLQELKLSKEIIDKRIRTVLDPESDE